MPEAPVKIGLTPDQQRGVETVGRSLLMSAAAGSGKTRVLAERCAYLVCDAPAAFRCDINELLVVTFTEAAATEMRERIGRTLQSAVHHCPDSRLQTQLALLEQAQISTLHSFCANLLRQHFHLVGLDPAFGVMDEHEARLLRLDVCRDVLMRRYENDRDEYLSRLLDGYYDGDDSRLINEVLRIHALGESLVEPERWAQQTLTRTQEAADQPLLESELGRELLSLVRRRIVALGERCNRALKALRTLGNFENYEQQVNGIRETCRHLYKQLQTESIDVVCEELSAIELPRLSPVKSTVPNKDLAKEQVDSVTKEFKEGSWRTLLKFKEAEWRDGMAMVLPHASELLSLVREFGTEYRRVKDESRQLDFSDLERFALTVLSMPNSRGQRPSPTARYYHRAFKQVLVDEYQDINELQNAILRLVSHESLTPQSIAGDAPANIDGDAAPTPSAGTSVNNRAANLPNLFSVGDVKQSIYRFRLADPAQFLLRETNLRKGIRGGEVIDLRQNFRSRGPLLEAINSIFQRVMTKSAVEIEYDDTQRLVPGRVFSDPGDLPVFYGAPIELHLLPRDAGDTDDAESEPADAIDANWDRTDREASLTASRILQIVGQDGSAPMHVYDRQSDAPRPAAYRDIVILLRSTMYKGDQFVRMLDRFGIPAFTASRSGFFESTEIRDVIAMLSLIDNQAQDLALAAYLRSPLARIANIEDIMATVVVAYRQAKPRVPFHEAVVRYVADHQDEAAIELQKRLAALAALRHQANRRPVHETIWEIYQQTGYLAYVAGLPGGRQRSANLIEFYDRARGFATHRRQDLGRFLDFLRTLEAEGDLGQASVATEAQNAVRIMTVHGSKGLEFPIVILPDMGKGINTRDEAGAVVVDRALGLGMAVVNEELFARYPSLGQLVVKDQIHRKLMAEELRVLYVAMTRAMEHLILVGTADADAQEGWEKRWAGHIGPLPDSTIVQARSALDWIGPIWAAEASAGKPTLQLTPHSMVELKNPQSHRQRGDLPSAAVAVRDRQPLGDGKPLRPEVMQIIERLEYVYPYEAESAHAAVNSVTAIAKAAPAAKPAEPDAIATTNPLETVSAEQRLAKNRLALAPFMTPETRVAAVEKGTATHAVLQYLRFNDAASGDAIRQQVQQMVSVGQVRADQQSAVDFETIEWFLSTDLGKLLRENEARLVREMPVYAAATAGGELADVDPARPEVGLDLMMVRGRADLFLPLPKEGVLVDYKTDNVTGDRLRERAAFYEPQLRAYAEAIARITGQPVNQRWLVFLTAREVVAV